MIDEGLAGIRRLRARALRHVRSRDLTRARTPNHVPHLSREPATRIIRVVLSRPTPSSKRTLDSLHSRGQAQINSEKYHLVRKETPDRSRAAKFSYHTGVLGHHVILRCVLRAMA